MVTGSVPEGVVPTVNRSTSGGQDSETPHSTQKPVECMRRPIVNNSSPGQAIYEPFSGSGTTIIACEMTGRKALAMEIEPAYVQVCLERWMAFTGKVATLDGIPFEKVAKARAKGKALGALNRKGAAEGAPPGTVAPTARAAAQVPR